MDAALVREFLVTLPDRPDDAGTVPRIRAYLEALGRPDVRYLLGAIRGEGAPTVARYARAVLEAAAATVASAGDPLDDALLAIAGTSVAATAYQLAALHPELGEPSRRDAEALLAFVAHAEASRRVLLLLDQALDPRAAVHGAVPDVVAIARASDDDLAAAIADAPERRPFVIAPRELSGIDAVLRGRGLPYVVGGRDFVVETSGTSFALAVGDERYAELALGPGDDPDLAATGVVTALAIASFGVRMRPEWVEIGTGAVISETLIPAGDRGFGDLPTSPEAVLITKPLRMTWTLTRSLARKPLVETKSREGKAIRLSGTTGGWCTLASVAGWRAFPSKSRCIDHQFAEPLGY